MRTATCVRIDCNVCEDSDVCGDGDVSEDGDVCEDVMCAWTEMM